MGPKFSSEDLAPVYTCISGHPLQFAKQKLPYGSLINCQWKKIIENYGRGTAV